MKEYKNFLDRFVDNFTAVDAYTLGSIAWSEWMDRKEKEEKREWREWLEASIAHDEELATRGCPEDPQIHLPKRLIFHRCFS